MRQLGVADGPEPVRILDAAFFAARAHSGQRRKGAAQEPYVSRVLEVADALARECGDSGRTPRFRRGGRKGKLIWKP